MAIKPLVLVFQEVRNPTATIINPTLSGCVIGPHYHIKTYDENKDEIFAGLYDLAVGTTVAALPAAIPGMKPKATGFFPYLDSVRALISDDVAGTDVTTDGLITVTTGAFLTDDVQPGDQVRIQRAVTAGTGAGDGGGANPNRVNLTGIVAGDLEIGDDITMAGVSFTSTVVSIEPTFLWVEVVDTVPATFAGEAIDITQNRFYLNRSTGQTYTVKNVVDGNNLYLNSDFPFADTGVDLEITRPVSKVVPDTYTFTPSTGILSIDPANTILLDALTRDLRDYSSIVDPTDADSDKARIFTEYQALDVTYAVFPAKITQNSDLATKLGITDSRNPLGLGATVMFANSQAIIHAIGLTSEDNAGWLTAIDAVNRGEFYAQGLLTQDTGIVGAYLANNIANEAPDVAKYGMVIGNHALPETVELADSTGDIVQDPSTLLYTILVDTTADFQNTANPVLPGDILTIGGTPRVVDSVINTNRVKVIAADDFGSASAANPYTITRDLNKEQQAASIAASSSSIGNKRAVMTWSDEVEISGERESGYYLNAAVAGMISGLPSHQGLTNKSIALITKVYNSNWDYFSEDEIDTIAAGGTCVFVQEEPEGLPFLRHQLTTDISVLETAEISVVKNNDFISLFFKGIVKPFLGEWNVTQELLDAITNSLQQGIDFQKANYTFKIGAPLIDATIDSVEISSISADRVEIYMDTQQPRPLNTIGLHIIV